jgi:hypothetical protein
MLRTLVCALVALVMVCGVALAAEKAQKKAKTKAVAGKFVSFKDGTLTLTVKKENKEFKIDAGTEVRLFKADAEKAEKLSAPDGFKDVKEGTTVRVVTSAEDNKIVRIVINPKTAKKKQ